MGVKIMRYVVATVVAAVVVVGLAVLLSMAIAHRMGSVMEVEPAPHAPCVTEDEYLRFDGTCVHVDEIKGDRG